MKLKYQWPLVWLLIFLLPIRDTLALSAIDNTLVQHLFWPLVHANILHWLLNTVTFMALWRIVTPARLFWGYLSSILIGYLYVTLNYQLSTVNSLCGISGIIFFLVGIIFFRIRRPYRIRLSLLVIISCFIPGIAALVHILSLLMGILYSKLAFSFRSRSSYKIV